MFPAGVHLSDDGIKVYNLNVGYNGQTNVGALATSGAAITVDASSFEIEFDTLLPYSGYRVEYVTIIDDYSKTAFENAATLAYGTKNLPAKATVDQLLRSDFIEKSGRYIGEDKIEWMIDVNKVGGTIDEAIIEENLPAGLSVDASSIEIYTLSKDGENWIATLSADKTATAFPINLGAITSNEATESNLTHQLTMH